MAKINLLPWREEHRQELKRQFFSILGGVAVLSGLCVYVVYSFYTSEVNNQVAKNKFIQGKTAELEVKITEIRELQDRRDQIVDSMKVIQELQGNRPVIVHTMGAIASTAPEGVYYTKIEKKGLVYTFYGSADTNNKISRLMRNLEESEWFQNPTLGKVEGSKETTEGEGEKLNNFVLTVNQEIPGQTPEEEAEIASEKESKSKGKDKNKDKNKDKSKEKKGK